MLDRTQSLVVPTNLIQHGLIDLKREALFYDKIIVVANGSTEQDSAMDAIGLDTWQFLEDKGLISFEEVNLFMTQEPPLFATEIDISLVAAWKIAYMEEILSPNGLNSISTLRELQAQALSRLATIQLNSVITDTMMIPIDYGQRWKVDLRMDQKYDEFEIKSDDRDYSVDPPLNKWNYYLDKFNNGAGSSYSEALSFIANDIQVADCHTNWGDIIDFREKLDNKLYLYRMKKKILEIADAGDRSNIKLEIQSEKIAFEEKMKSLRKIKSLQLVKSIITFSASLIPNIVKLNWGSIAEDGIEIVERSFSGIDSMIEIKNNGMYYLHRVEKSFH